MTCDEVRAALAEAPGAGDAADSGVEAHLAECAACREEAEEVRALGREVKRAFVTADGLPAPSFERVLERVRAGRGGARVIGRRLLLRAAALLLAAAAGGLVDRAIMRAPPASTERLEALREAKASDGRLREAARAALEERPGGLGASIALLSALRSRP